MVIARKALQTTSTRLVRIDERSGIKCIYYSKSRHLEPECYSKYLEKKAAFNRMIAEKKALKKQQALLKAIPTSYVATIPAIPILLPSTLYKFGNGTLRTFIATTLGNLTKSLSLELPKLLSPKYTFRTTVYINIADIEKV